MREVTRTRAPLRSPAVEIACERFDAVPATGEDADPHGFVAPHWGRNRRPNLRF